MLASLKSNTHKVNSKKIVKNILNNNKKNICPMELKALKVENNRDFFFELKNKNPQLDLSV